MNYCGHHPIRMLCLLSLVSALILLPRFLPITDVTAMAYVTAPPRSPEPSEQTIQGLYESALGGPLTAVASDQTLARLSGAGSIPLRTERRGHTVTGLPGGKALIVGGENKGGAVDSIEMLDLSSSTVSRVARLRTARSRHTATLLPDGRVLIAGGFNSRKEPLRSTEIFNPQTESISVGPRLKRTRAAHTATALRDGRILYAGGSADDSSELFDPAQIQFSLIDAKMESGRSFHGAILLEDDTVLIAGGIDKEANPLRTAELFDSVSSRFLPTAEKMNVRRILPRMRALPDGKIQIIAGDYDGTMEIYDPMRRSFDAPVQLVHTADIFPASKMIASQTRDAFIVGIKPDDATMRVSTEGKEQQVRYYSESVESSLRPFSNDLDRVDYASAEVPEFGVVVIVGGISRKGTMVSSVTVIASSRATITTDSAQYRPGQGHIISGSGWAPGEMIQIVRQEALPAHKRKSLRVVADQQGNFVHTELPGSYYPFGVNYTLTALGQTSGYVAQTGYRDSPIDPSRLDANRINVSMPLVNRDGSMETEYGLLVWEANGDMAKLRFFDQSWASSSPAEIPKGESGSRSFDPYFVSIDTSGSFVLLDDAPVSSIPCELIDPDESCFEVVIKAGSTFSFSGTLTADVTLGSASVEVNQSITTNQIFDITVAGDFDLPDIPIPGMSVTLEAEIPDTNIGVSVTVGVVVKLTATITKPGTTIGVTMNFSEGFRIGASLGDVFAENTVDPVFNISPTIAETHGGCLTLRIGPKISASAGADLEVCTVGATANAGVFGFGKACLDPRDANTSGCWDIGFDAGVDASVDANIAICAGIFPVTEENFILYSEHIGDILGVIDDAPPSINVPADITQSTDPNSCGAIVSYNATADDACSGIETFSCNPATGSFFAVGTTPVNCTATDKHGHSSSSSFNVTVSDTEGPMIGICPDSRIVSTDPGECKATVTFATPEATDNCSVSSVVCSPPSGSKFDKGTTTVNCTATDSASNQASCSFTVTVNDNEAPELFCPANIIVPTDPNECSAVVPFLIRASDNCSIPTVMSSPASGSVFPKGTTTVNVTARDSSGNTVSCSFTVTVEDRQAPAVSCPANITVPTEPDKCSAVVSFSFGATDNCEVAMVASNPPSGSVFPKGTTTVIVTATDTSSNTSICSFTVTVVDRQVPTITNVSASTYFLWPPDHQMVDVTIGYNVTDNCTPSSAIVCALSVTSNEPINGTGDGDTAPDWEILDAHSLRLRAERAGTGNGRIYTITITCTDADGNASSKTVRVRVPQSQS